MIVKLYVEGGGDRNKALQAQCRRGFSQLLEKAGMRGRMPRIVVCGGRRQAFNRFRSCHESSDADEKAVLLVDSEGPLTSDDPWGHVEREDKWERPTGVTGDQIHLMVQCMEAFFHADKEALAKYFGDCFRASALSPRVDVENIPKADLFSGLRRSTKDCQRKGSYSKGEHSFHLLAEISPEKITAASPNAARFLKALDSFCHHGS